MKFSMETIKQIWDDESGDRVEVGPDSDGLGLIEIRSRDSSGKIDGRLAFPKEQAALVGQALLDLSQ